MRAFGETQSLFTNGDIVD